MVALGFSVRDFILSGRGTAIHDFKVLVDAYRVLAPVQAVHFTKTATAAGGADSVSQCHKPVHLVPFLKTQHSTSLLVVHRT